MHIHVRNQFLNKPSKGIRNMPRTRLPLMFDTFVEATRYCTEAERFGWSFVFWSHIPADPYS
jgi:hypothetical protein